MNHLFSDKLAQSMRSLNQARLSLRSINHFYQKKQILSDVNLNLNAEEVVCLLGPSGCGKSTTLRIAAGVERQQEGEVLINGEVISDKNIHMPPDKRNIGLIFQDFALFPHLTIAQNVAFGLKDMSERKKYQVAVEALQRVQLRDAADKYAHQLSGGEQQRVALMRALVTKPKVMLMDEPFSGLDNRLRDEVRDEALDLLKREGSAVLLVTHEPDEAMRMSHRIALMREGKIIQQGAPYQIYNHPVDRRAAAFFSDINVIHGVVQSRQTETPFGRFLTPTLTDNADVEIIIRPQHLKIDVDDGSTPPPKPNPKTGAPALGRVERARFMGADSLVEVRMQHDNSLLRASIPGAFLPEVGQTVWLSLRRDHCFVFPCVQQSRVKTPWIDGVVPTETQNAFKQTG
jgi:iron(III) transport system ATP-binding protein